MNINLERLEDCLNGLSMDDPHEGYRPVHAAAQLYFERNEITNGELTQIEASLEALVARDDLDRSIERPANLFRSQKFGSKRSEYLSILEQKAAEEEAAREQAECLQDKAEELNALLSTKKSPYFERDYSWYSEVCN